MFVSFQNKYYFRFITCSPHTYTTTTLQQVPGAARAEAATRRRPRPARTAASTPRTTARPPTRPRPTRTRTRASPWRLRKFARKRWWWCWPTFERNHDSGTEPTAVLERRRAKFQSLGTTLKRRRSAEVGRRKRVSEHSNKSKKKIKESRPR